MNNKYKYSEIFTSIQGEGEFTGISTLIFRTSARAPLTTDFLPDTTAGGREVPIR